MPPADDDGDHAWLALRHVGFFVLSAAFAWLSLNASFPHRIPPLRGRRWWMASFVLSWASIELGLHLSLLQTSLVCLALALNDVALFDEPLAYQLSLLVSLGCSCFLAFLYARGAGNLSAVAEQGRQQRRDIDERLHVHVEPFAPLSLNPFAAPPVQRLRWRELLLPFRWAASYADTVTCQQDVRYGPHPLAHLLDVYAPTTTATAVAPSRGRPVLVVYHGGAWQTGSKSTSHLPLVYKLAARGWLCVNVDYRLSCNQRYGDARWPDHLDDCTLALHFVRQHAASWGADPSFIVLAGGSAGAHIATVMALASHHEPWLRAVVSLYGVYDLLRPGNRALFARRVLRLPADDPSLERRLADASPCSIVVERCAVAPQRLPHFLLVQGTHDSLTPLDGHRHFADLLRRHAHPATLVHRLEIDGAQHAFDNFGSVRSAAGCHGIICWLSALWTIYNQTGQL